jgi:hypothetical protein
VPPMGGDQPGTSKTTRYIWRQVMSIVLKYIIEREKYFNSIGEYFCQSEDKCKQQCESCNKYFEDRLIKEQSKGKK